MSIFNSPGGTEDSKNKLPLGSICLVGVLLLTLLLLLAITIVARVHSVISPLNSNISNESVIDSKYIDFHIVEQGENYVIYVDQQTGVLYMEIKSNGYSSAITVLLNEDGTPKKLSDY